MRFKRRRGIAERWTRSEIHHSSDRSARRLHTYGVYTFRRQKLPRRRSAEVQGRESDRAPALCVLEDPPAHGVEAPEGGRRALEVAAGNCATDGSRRDRVHIGRCYRIDDLLPITISISEGDQQY